MQTNGFIATIIAAVAAVVAAIVTVVLWLAARKVKSETAAFDAWVEDVVKELREHPGATPERGTVGRLSQVDGLIRIYWVHTDVFEAEVELSRRKWVARAVREGHLSRGGASGNKISVRLPD